MRMHEFSRALPYLFTSRASHPPSPQLGHETALSSLWYTSPFTPVRVTQNLPSP